MVAQKIRTESDMKSKSDTLIITTFVGPAIQPKGFIRVLGHELRFHSWISNCGWSTRRTRKLGASN